MNQRKKSLLIIFLILVLIPLIAWGGLELFDANNYFKYRITSLFPWLKGVTTEIGDVRFEIVSEIPGYTVDSSSIDTALLKDLLTKLELYPLKEKPFIVVLDENKQPISSNLLSPQRVKIILRPVSQLDGDKQKNPEVAEKLFYSVEFVERPRFVYIEGTLKNNGKDVEIPVYVDHEIPIKYPYISEQILMNDAVLTALFFNFHAPPISDLGQPYSVYREKVGKVEVPLFSFKKSNTLNWSFNLQNISLVQSAFACCYFNNACQTSGTVSCGNLQDTPGICSAPYGSITCNDDTDCPGGTTCDGDGVQCNSSGSGSCFNSGGSGGSCLYSCSGCVAGGNSQCALPPPPSGNYCGNDTCAGSETCLNCAVDCGVCECSAIPGDGDCCSSAGESCDNPTSDCGSCPPPPPPPPSSDTLTVNLTAFPNAGISPLFGISLRNAVGGSASGNINYQLDCDKNVSDASQELTVTNSNANYNSPPFCIYLTPGTYTARVIVTREGLTATDEADVDVVAAGSPSLSVNTIAIPDTGPAPLDDVDIEVTVGGSASGTIDYQVDCLRDGGAPDAIGTSAVNAFTIFDVCDYPFVGTFTPETTVSREGVNSSDFTTVVVTGGGVCAVPTPIDLGSPACVPTPGGTSLVTWQWDRVVNANQYLIDIYDANTNTVFLPGDWVNASEFSCELTTPCEYPIPMPVGSYYSQVRAQSTDGVCTPSAFSLPSPTEDVVYCGGSVQAKAVVVDSTFNTCPFINDPSAPVLAGTEFNLSGPGIFAPQTQPGSGYVTWDPAAVGFYTLSATPPVASNYVLQNYCWNINPPPPPPNDSGQTSSANLSQAGATLTYNVGFSVIQAWFQIIGGGIKVPDGRIDVSIPGGENFVEPEVPGQTSPFVVYGPGNSLTNTGAGQISPDNYEVENGPEIIPAGFSYYNYYSSRFGNKIAMNSVPASVPASGVYQYTGPGDMVIANPWNVPAGDSVVIFVPTGKNFIVEAPIQVQEGGFLGVIGAGEMRVAAGVGRNPPFQANYDPVSDAHVSGICIFNRLVTEADPGPDKQLILSGTYVVDEVSLGRNLESENTFPAEEFMYRADLWQNAPDELKEINITWQEVKPR